MILWKCHEGFVAVAPDVFVRPTQVSSAWRIIPGLVTMVIVRFPKDRVVGPLPNGLCLGFTSGLQTTYDTWDDPPTTSRKGLSFFMSVISLEGFNVELPALRCNHNMFLNGFKPPTGYR